MQIKIEVKARGKELVFSRQVAQPGKDAVGDALGDELEEMAGMVRQIFGVPAGSGK